MEFNSDQGKMMQGRNCRVNGRAKCAEGRDRGVQVHSSLKVMTHLDRAVKVFDRCAFIGKDTEYSRQHVML